MNAEPQRRGGVSGEVKKAEYDNITEKIIAAAIDVHRELGPGLLESVYEICLLKELKSRAEFQRPSPEGWNSKKSK